MKPTYDELVKTIQHLCDTIAPTVKSEGRLSQGLSSALIQARALLARIPQETA